MERITLRVEEISAVEREDWPVTSGIPLCQGDVLSKNHLALYDADGTPVPCQFRGLARWPDGSIKWVLLDFQAKVGKQSEAFYYLGNDLKGVAPSHPHPITVRETQDEIIVDTGAISAVLRTKQFDLIHALTLGQERLIEPCSQTVRLTDSQGRVFDLSSDPSSRARIEESGPMRVCIKAEGVHRSGDGEQLFDWIVRIYFYAGQPFVKLYYTFVNREDAAEVLIESLQFTSRLSDPGTMVGLLDADWAKPVPQAETKLRFERFLSEGFGPQEGGGSSASTPQATGPVANANRKQYEVYEPCTFAQYEEESMYNPVYKGKKERPCGLYNQKGELVIGSDFTNGWADISNGTHGVGVAFLGGQHLPPKAFHIAPGELSLDLLAAEHDPFPINMGVAKTHVLFCYFHPGTGREARAQSRMHGWIGFGMDGELHATCPGDWLSRTKACGEIMPYLPRKYPELENFFRNDFVGKAGPRRGEGVLDFGDFGHPNYRNHVSGGFEHLHDDVGHSMLVQYLRTGEMMYRELGEAAAFHYMDVDTMHRVPEEIAEREGCGRYHNANDDDRFAAVLSHAWLVTNLTYYYMTGYRRSLETMIGSADAFVRMVDKGYAHLDPEERALGWCLTELTTAFTVTEDKKYLTAARKVIDIALERQTNEGEFSMAGLRGLVWNSAPTQVGTLVMGMKRYYEITREEDVKEAILKGLEFAMTKGELPEGYQVKGKFGNGLYKGQRETSGCESLRTLESFAYAYKLTGDRLYIEHGVHYLRHTLNHLHIRDPVGSSCMYLADTLEFLKVADEIGLLEDLD